jgi:ubiquinone/menaquinone biosynthesis C-methylase UbiE
MESSQEYVHGYSEREAVRLDDQSRTLAELLHGDEIYPAGTLVLEAGCGTGCQTRFLAANNPKSAFTCVDISANSLGLARAAARERGFTNVCFQQASLFKLPFADGLFDVVFVCFVLEHLSDPAGAMGELMRVLKPGGQITVIEGDHGSAYFYPDSVYARRSIQCLVDLQAQAGGDALIGRRLYPLLCQAGFQEVAVTPRVVYADSSRPQWVEGFTKNTFTAMVAGVERQVLEANMMTKTDWRQAIADLYRSAQFDGVFNYTFFKARGIKPS